MQHDIIYLQRLQREAKTNWQASNHRIIKDMNIEEIKRRIVEILNKYHLHKYDNPMQQDLEDLHDSIWIKKKA